MEKQIYDAEFIEDISLTGDLIHGLDNKKFEIIEKPQYEISPDLDNPEQMKKKLIMNIKLEATGQILKYYPNKTSRDTILRNAGAVLLKWVGYKGEFYTEKMKVGKDIKQVVFIK